MRRRIALPAVAALAVTALALTGCSNNPSSGSGSNTLKVYTSSDTKSQVEPIFTAFEKANPGVKINVEYGTGNDFEQTEITQLTSGAGPDIVDVLPGNGGSVISVGSLVKKGYIADLSDRPWTKDIPKSLRSQTDIDGKTYSFPGTLQPLGAFYNTAAVKAAGATVPKTWSEVLAFCSSAKAAGKVAYSLGLSDQWVTQLIPYSLIATLLYAKDPNWNDKLVSGKATFPDSKWKDALTKYQDMDKAGCFSKDPNGISFTNTLPPVAKGDALAIVQVGGIFSQLQDLDKSVSYELQPLPATDDASATYMAASPGHGMALNAKSKNKDLATKFLDFIATPEQTNTLAELSGGGVPAIPNSTFKASALLEPFTKMVAEGKVSAFPDTGWPNPEIQNAHLVGIQNMFLGKETPEQVLTDMQNAVKQ